MFKKLLRRLLEHTIVSAAVFTAIIAGSSIAFAALIQTPNYLAPADIGQLNSQLLATDTGATIAPIKKWVNGVRVTQCFDSPAAFILIEDDLGRREWASYSSKSCSSDHITTLSGMRRGLSPNSPSFSAGTGLSFDAGATVSVNDYPMYINNAVYKDVQNGMTQSGMIICRNARQGCIAVGSYTTTQRDSFTHLTGSMIIRNSTLDSLQWYNGSSWYSLATATGSFVFASDTIAGKVQDITLAHLQNRTQTGATGALNVITPRFLVGTGTTHGTDNTGYKWRIPVINALGALSSTLGGLGRVNAESGSLIVGQGSGAVKMLAPGNFNNIPISDGFSWNSGRPTRPLTTQLARFTPSAAIFNVAGGTGTLMSLVVTGSTLSVGSSYEINASGTGALAGGGGSMRINITFGGITFAFLPSASTSYSAVPWHIRGKITVVSTGSSGKFIFAGDAIGLNSSTLVQVAPVTLQTINTTIDNTLSISAYFSNHGGGVNGLTLYQGIFQRYN